MYQSIIDSAKIGRDDLGFGGVTVQLLGGDPDNGGLYILMTMAPGARVPAHRHSGANEFAFVISGDFVEAGTSYGPGTSFMALKGTPHGPHTTVGGCVVLTHYSGPLDFEPVS